MWLGEQITIDGIGNGISIILFAGIVSRFPTLIKQLFQYLSTGRLVYRILVPNRYGIIHINGSLYRIYG